MEKHTHQQDPTKKTTQRESLVLIFLMSSLTLPRVFVYYFENTSKGAIDITKSDLARLQPCGYLNDNIIIVGLG